MLPTFQAPQHLDIYDIRSAPHDVQLSVTTMAGLINRPQPQVYFINTDDDIFWLKEALSSIPHDTPSVPHNAVLDAFLATYRSRVQGMIIYDPNFVDSINIATTLAGQRDGLVVSPAQAETLQQEPHTLPILADLRTYHWHTRLDAYSWAQQHLLDKASPRLIAGLDPNIVTGLRSFLVAARTFVYWLDSRKFLPDPAHGWTSERCLMAQILKALPPGGTHLGWFIDEGSGVTLTSHAAKAVLASDFFSNLEVWTSIVSVPSSGSRKAIAPAAPRGKVYTPNPKRSSANAIGSTAPIIKQELNQGITPAPKVYISFTISDGDNLQYNQHRMLKLWRDPARGSVPIGWTISPVLPQAAPNMAAYYTRTATHSDELIAGPSGAGYIFPSRWPKEYLPAFLERTGQLMRDWNLSLLEVLDTTFLQGIGIAYLSFLDRRGMLFADPDLQRQFARALAPFGVRGIFSGAGLVHPTWAISAERVPIYQNLGLASSVDRTVSLIQGAASARDDRPLFLNVYVLAWTMTPSDLKQVVERLGRSHDKSGTYEVVTPGTLLALITQMQ